MFRRRPREHEDRQDARDAGRNGEKDQKRIEERAELGDEHQVDQDDGEEQAEAERLEGDLHGADHAPDIHPDVLGARHGRDDLLDRPADPAELLAGGGDEDVGDAAELVMVDLGGRLGPLDGGDGVEPRGGGKGRPAQGDAPEVVERDDVAFRVLDGEEVGIPGLRIDPEARGDHLVRVERGDDVAHHLLLVQAELGGLQPVHVDPQRRCVDVLRHQDVADAGEVAHPAGDLRGDLVARLRVVSADLDVDRGREAEVEDCVDEASRLEVAGELRELRAEGGADAVHVLVAADLVVPPSGRRVPWRCGPPNCSCRARRNPGPCRCSRRRGRGPRGRRRGGPGSRPSRSPRR